MTNSDAMSYRVASAILFTLFTRLVKGLRGIIGAISRCLFIHCCQVNKLRALRVVRFRGAYIGIWICLFTCSFEFIISEQPTAPTMSRFGYFLFTRPDLGDRQSVGAVGCSTVHAVHYYVRVFDHFLWCHPSSVVSSVNTLKRKCVRARTFTALASNELKRKLALALKKLTAQTHIGKIQNHGGLNYGNRFAACA